MRGIDVCLFQVSSKSAVIEKRPLMGMAMGMATGAGGGVGMGVGMGMGIQHLAPLLDQHPHQRQRQHQMNNIRTRR